jgi:hypothetical protein
MRKCCLRRLFVIPLFFFFAGEGFGQSFDLENIKKDVKEKTKNKKPWKITGGINASSVFYTGNAGSGREAFNYFINGNVAFSIYGVTVPASFSFTNRGFSYQYRFPNLPNRLSLHPKYKWITGHIGDVAMTFSPYTLSGHQFSGVGFDLTPRGNWKYSVMYGRLQRAVEWDTASRGIMPSYLRRGAGAKIMYEKDKLRFGASIFQAMDDVNSLRLKPDSLQIYPQKNTAISFETALPVMKNLVLQAEIGMSGLTRDVRAPKYNDSLGNGSWLQKIFGAKASTNFYKAFKSQLNYTIGSSSMGVGYERIDPGYQTLGAYYFNNDLENITVNFAQALFKGKVNMSGNIGFQRDDLKHDKTGGSQRMVNALNINYNASEKLTTSLAYSNFQTFTNIKPQFQYINQLTPYDNLDTLNFRQLSQNANLNVNYIIGKDKNYPQNLNINIGFQDAFDEQGGIISKGNASQFYNFAGSYSRTNVKKAMNVVGAFNLTYNTIGKNEILTWGPTLMANKQFFSNTVRTGASVSYNVSKPDTGAESQVISFRMNAGYVYKKKHNISLTGVGMVRSIQAQKSLHDITMTLAYNYAF